jgi:hypothetical protein
LVKCLDDTGGEDDFGRGGRKGGIDRLQLHRMNGQFPGPKRKVRRTRIIGILRILAAGQQNDAVRQVQPGRDEACF